MTLYLLLPILLLTATNCKYFIIHRSKLLLGIRGHDDNVLYYRADGDHCWHAVLTTVNK